MLGFFLSCEAGRKHAQYAGRKETRQMTRKEAEAALDAGQLEVQKEVKV